MNFSGYLPELTGHLYIILRYCIYVEGKKNKEGKYWNYQMLLGNLACDYNTNYLRKTFNSDEVDTSIYVVRRF